MQRVVAVSSVAVLCMLAGTADAAPPAHTESALGGRAPWTQIDGTGPRGDAAQAVADARLDQESRGSRSDSSDVGDVAVIVDNGTIVTPPRPARPVDLVTPAGVAFSPTAEGFAARLTPGDFEQPAGVPLPLSDDDSHRIDLPFTFPFLGREHGSVFVNSDGNLTFDADDSLSTPRDAARLVSGPPRIAPFLHDLDPSVGGAVLANVLPDRLVVTWQDVPEFGVDNLNTLQVMLMQNGEIRFAYRRLGSTAAVVGVAEGDNHGPLNAIDLTAALPASYSAGAIFEEFAPAQPLPFFNSRQAARIFYQTHQDKYDYVVFFTDVPADLGGGAFAYHAGVVNRTRGIGRNPFDFSFDFGAHGELESVLAMNNIHLYMPTAQRMVDPPIQTFPGFRIEENISYDRARLFGTDDGLFGRNFGALRLGLNSAMSLMAQEVGHRWLAFTPFVHPETGVGPDSFDLLGRGLAHWSFFANAEVPPHQFGGEARSSGAEGNVIRDLGPAAGPCAVPGQTRFQTDARQLVDGFSRLDQHLMGLRSARSVNRFWYVDRPTTVSGRSLRNLAGLFPMSGALFCGERVDLGVERIQAFPGVGPRMPAIGDEDDTGTGVDVKTMAFVLIAAEGPPAAERNRDAILQVDRLRRTWQAYGNGPATDGLGRFDTSLSPGIH